MAQDDFEAEFQEAVMPLVDDLIQENFAAAPPDLLVPEKIWRENLRKELIDVCTGKEIRNRLASAENVILEDLKSRLSPVEFEKFQADWKQGVEKIVNEKMTPPQEGTFPPTLQSLMGITEETMVGIYEVGVRCYKRKEFIKAADVFFFMTLIDYLRHNVWISLGLSEQQSGHFDLALTAFSMAVMTNVDNPVAYLQSAECSLALQNGVEAKQYLDLAEEPIGKASGKTKQGFLDQLHVLQQKCKIL
jgi:hypothetical protein